jgi:predicted AlkP superfamily phosphohydrolase/phosphomutase
VPAPRLTIIGLDAATFDVIDPLIEADELPHLARLLNGGARGVLESTTHPLTPHAWTTMVTGVNAARHGIWDFVERDASGYDLRVVNGSYRRAPAIWDRLARAGLRVGLVNVPFTWPPPEVEGFVVSGFDTATHDDMTHPRELLAELEGRFGPLVLDHRFPVSADGGIDLDQVRRTCEQKVEIALSLTRELKPDLLFLVFMSADHIHHLAWPEWERDGARSPVADVYRTLDRAVGELLDGLPEGGDVLVVSDHGGGSLEGVVNLNAWLAEQGFLSYRGVAGTSRRLVNRLLLLRRKLLSESARRAIKRRAPDLSERAARRSAEQALDLSRTRAFAYGTFGNIVVNLRGRERDGIVEPADYDRVRDEIAAGLLELESPAGRPIVRAVHRREDMFEGDFIHTVPDLLVEFEDYAWLGKGNLQRRTSTIWDTIEIERGSSLAYVGSHRQAGIVALAGPSAQPGAQIGARIEDIAPTVLHLLGEPIPEDLEGRVLTEALDPAVLERRPLRYAEADDFEIAATKGYDAAEAAEVEGRLRSLGYLE